MTGAWVCRRRKQCLFRPARRAHKKTWLWASSAVIDSFPLFINTNTSVLSQTLGTAYGTLDPKDVLQDSRSSKKLSNDAKTQHYLSVIQTDLSYGSKAFYSSLPQTAEHFSRLSKRGGGGRGRAIFSVPPWWTHTEPLLREMKLCSIDLGFKLKLFIHTYRCMHGLGSPSLCQQYKVRSPSNSTHSTTRFQPTFSLCIPSVTRRPGTISPLFTSSLLWNSFPSPLRPTSSLNTFGKELEKYLGFSV